MILFQSKLPPTLDYDSRQHESIFRNSTDIFSEASVNNEINLSFSHPSYFAILSIVSYQYGLLEAADFVSTSLTRAFFK